MEVIKGLMRTHHCGALRTSDIGKEVALCGWVNKYRDLGALHFIDLRDKYGVTQLGFEEFKGDLSVLKNFSLESVIQAKGIVRARPEAAQNKNMETGEVEVQVQEVRLLSQAERVPFLPYGATEASEDLKLKYRYLDIRSKRLQDIIALRSKVTRAGREALYAAGFTEVETPILYKTTPEGARDYVVPSRVHKGKVYALPQSPQTLKQLLMIGGTDKYFQIARCFRDEDLRADRQPEFTQVDIEVSFPTMDYMKNLAEHLVRCWFDLPSSFTLKGMSYDEAMNDYGCDKPDVRFGLKQKDVTKLFVGSDFTTFATVASNGGLVKAMFLPLNLANPARKDIDELTEVVKPYGGKGVAWFKTLGGEFSGGISKFVTAELYSKLSSEAENQGDGLWLFFADSKSKVAHDCSDATRRHLGKKFKLYNPESNEFLWVYDFPLLDYDDEAERFVAMHHPFTMPRYEDLEAFMGDDKTKKLAVKAQAYDIVCNGYEIGGGSVRIFDTNVQSQMFKNLGMTEEETKHQFGFFIEALKYGTPPHAGMAFGLDRLVMMIAKTDSIRDVIAFPKTTSATDLMASAPSVPHEAQTRELGFSWLKD